MRCRSVRTRRKRIKFKQSKGRNEWGRGPRSRCLLSAAVNFIVQKKVVVSVYMSALVACSSVFPPVQLSSRVLQQPRLVRTNKVPSPTMDSVGWSFQLIIPATTYLDIYIFDTFREYPFVAFMAFPLLYTCALALGRILTGDRPESDRRRERTPRNRGNSLKSLIKVACV